MHPAIVLYVLFLINLLLNKAYKHRRTVNKPASISQRSCESKGKSKIQCEKKCKIKYLISKGLKNEIALTIEYEHLCQLKKELML